VRIQGLLFKQYNNNNNNISRNADTLYARGSDCKIYNTYNKYDYVYREQYNITIITIPFIKKINWHYMSRIPPIIITILIIIIIYYCLKVKICVIV